MRGRLLLLLGVAPALATIAVACGLDEGGLLGENEDASVGPPAPDASLLDVQGSGSDDGASDALDGAPNSDAGDGGASADADASDAPVDAPDAGPCEAGIICNGACDDDASTCVACSGAPLLCAATGTCGSNCTACPGSPIQCFNCDFNRENAVGTCEVDDASVYCLNDSDYPTANGLGYHCGCPDNDAGECPGATQTCADLGGIIDPGNVCKTCGEPNTAGQPCKMGGECNLATATCQ